MTGRFFSPSDDTLHAVKARYDHLVAQRTQMYGNLWYEKQSLSKVRFEHFDIVGRSRPGGCRPGCEFIGREIARKGRGVARGEAQAQIPSIRSRRVPRGGILTTLADRAMRWTDREGGTSVRRAPTSRQPESRRTGTFTGTPR